MKYIIRLLCFLFFILLANNLLSQVVTMQTLIDKTLEHDPQLIAFRYNLERIEYDKQIAEQRINPSLEGRILYGMQEKSLGGEYTILHTIETAGKRSKREKLAGNQLSIKQHEYNIAKTNAIKRLILTLIRLRQVNHEIALYSEAKTTYNNMIAHFNKIKRLSPEQSTGLSLLRFAVIDTEGKLSESISEQNDLLLFLQEITAKFWQVKQLPEISYQQWPTPKKQIDETSPVILVAQSRLGVAWANFRLQEALQYPDIALGPSFEHSQVQGKSDYNIGGGFGLTMPLYHQYQGERNQAEAGVKEAKANLDTVKRIIRLKRQGAIYAYQKMSTEIESMKRSNPSKGNHWQVHNYMNRGIISVPMAVEHHRGEIAFYETYHILERKAVGNLWDIYIIDGYLVKAGQDLRSENQ